LRGTDLTQLDQWRWWPDWPRSMGEFAKMFKTATRQDTAVKLDNTTGKIKVGWVAGEGECRNLALCQSGDGARPSTMLPQHFTRNVRGNQCITPNRSTMSG